MADKKRGLGTGLNALFADTALPEEEEKKEVSSVPIGKVEPRSDQPRKDFDEEALRELSDSIREYGLIQPLTVRKLDNGYYQIIAGERRWRASRMAGLKEVPVRVIEADDKLADEMALVENLQREDLKPLEEARGYRRLMQEYGMTQEEVSRRVQKSRPAVANALRLLNLSAPVLAMVENGELSAGHARALLALEREDIQLAAAKKTVGERLSVRQVEALSAKLRREPKKPEPRLDTVDYRAEAERTLSDAMGREVRIAGGIKKGRIVLSFYSADDREELMEALMQIKKKK